MNDISTTQPDDNGVEAALTEALDNVHEAAEMHSVLRHMQGTARLLLTIQKELDALQADTDRHVKRIREMLGNVK